jgi:hypothetical protein
MSVSAADEMLPAPYLLKTPGLQCNASPSRDSLVP